MDRSSSPNGAGLSRGFTTYGPSVAEEFDEDIDDEVPDEFAAALGGRRAPHWRLLVLEDTGELLRPEAKSIIGQGLSRFLNVVDGLIGQGLRVLVLVTTNERIETLHPAVARPGRCAANIEFDRSASGKRQRGSSCTGSLLTPTHHGSSPRSTLSSRAETQLRHRG